MKLHGWKSNTFFNGGGKSNKIGTKCLKNVYFPEVKDQKHQAILFSNPKVSRGVS